MKKVLAIILVLTLVLASAITVFAGSANLSDSDTETDIDVNIVLGSTSNVHKYHVVVQWEDLTFTYTPSNSTWNPGTHQYDSNHNATWSDDKSVTITNHSDLEVYYRAYLNKGTGADKLTYNDGNTTITLIGDYTKALQEDTGHICDHGTITVQPDGTTDANKSVFDNVHIIISTTTIPAIVTP